MASKGSCALVQFAKRSSAEVAAEKTFNKLVCLFISFSLFLVQLQSFELLWHGSNLVVLQFPFCLFNDYLFSKSILISCWPEFELIFIKLPPNLSTLEHKNIQKSLVNSDLFHWLSGHQGSTLDCTLGKISSQAIFFNCHIFWRSCTKHSWTSRGTSNAATARRHSEKWLFQLGSSKPSW